MKGTLNLIKPKIIIFEGTDKVGKSTLYKEFNEATNYSFFCIDRFTASGYVYDKVYNREDRVEAIQIIEKSLNKSLNSEIYLIYLYCDLNLQIKRIKELDKFSEDRLNNLRLAKDLYKDYLDRICSYNVIEIDTTNKSIKSTTEEIIFKINNYGSNN